MLAVLINPVLRADRDRAGVNTAQFIVAGILPNPQLSYSRDFVTSGPGPNRFGIGIAWDFTSLITRGAKVRGVRCRLFEFCRWSRSPILADKRKVGAIPR